MKRIVILASGSGSNAENIITYFTENPKIQVAAVLTNKSSAKVLERCDRLQIPAFYFNRSAFMASNTVVQLLKGIGTDMVVLAGFLWKIPQNIIDTYPNQIINIHPALLPKYGGKGMYGERVHQAVKENGETETGITIHYVNEHYDEGAIIFQAKTAVEPSDNPDSIAQKVHQLEYEHFPKVIEKLLI
ncbi:MULTISPECIES: phosphoribosylglycinamide formyltransferase [Flagellimonas]|uniref:phosphoribosylglycinamide formyltransferase 1 n=1 Tax=Flagellimonas hadalis TaxID=2597517 RepID=A0A5N5IWL2_9FLAO|nr:phosphoribosylglycinamide formyltransferase [Allomuricauda hadalis]KAB5490703.1 phosphoribosylglycinamide formyltransferase [Allomuricauda hadalis]RUA14640.1 MAG: phosphoribosylglycinamide formyltransferase [Flavobacteriia bacterium]